MNRKKVKNKYANIYSLGSWMKGINDKIGNSNFGELIGGANNLGSLAYGATSLVNNAINPNGNTTGVGDALQGIGSLASNIPGIGGVLGAGVNLVGGLVNTMFGSNIDEDFVAQTENNINQQANYKSSARDNSSLMSDWSSLGNLSHVSQDDVGSDGWFSNKAKNKTEELNKAIDAANYRAWSSLSNTANNVDRNNDMLAMSNFSAYGGPITMRYTGPMSPFGNTFAEGGGIHIKPENRGKFTALKKRTGKSATWFKEHGTPVQRKMATFALNTRKWKHEDGGPLRGLVDDINRRSNADFVQRLKDPNRDYIQDWASDNIATHKLSWATDDNGAIVFPNVQRIDGVLYDFTDPKNKRGKWDALDSAIQRGDTLRMTPNQAKEFTETYKSYYPKGKTFRAEGGPLFTHGGIWSNGMTEINEGGTHEENPFEGVQMGIDPQGIPNLVEEGEVVYNDYVFSRRMKVPKDIKKKLKLKGDTFADAAKELSKESNERPNDPISKNGLDYFMNTLAENQEELRMKNENRKANRYAKGGKLGNKFEGTGPDDNYMDFGTLTSPIYEEQLDRIRNYNNKSSLSYLRYAPAIMSGISTISDIFSKPDYSAADRIDSVGIQPALVSSTPIGQYLSYRPFDRMFYINQLNKNTAAGRRAIQNTSGGNRAAAMAGILASDYNYGESLGKLARQAEEYNQALKERVAEFNRGTDTFNSESSLKAQMANQQSMNNANKLRLAQAEEVARYRQAARDAYDTRRSNNLNNFITNLGNIGTEEEYASWLDNLARRGVLLMDTEGNYTGGPKANGGKLKRKRRNTYA